MSSVANFLRNSLLGVEKDTYLQMCEEMGTEPVPEETPVSFQELAYELQLSISIYRSLPNVYSDASGCYLNKDYSALETYFKAHEIPQSQWSYYLDFLGQIDRVEGDAINNKVSQMKEVAKNGK